MGKVRIAIVGMGGMARGHAEYLINHQIPDAELTAACDSSPTQLEWVAKNYGNKVAVFPDYDKMLASDICDAVLIATPHYSHPPLAIKAFNAGKHVLIEKPAGVYTKQVKEMNKIAADSGKVFGIMLNQRTLGYYRKLRELVQGGELGQIKRAVWIITDWYRTEAYYKSGSWRATWAGEGGGVLLNQCPHNLDLWQWICGMPSKVRAFCGFGKYHNIEVEDDVTAYMEYSNGATGLFVTTTGEFPGTNRWEITGERGKVVLENGNITFWRTNVPISNHLKESPGGFDVPECWQCHVPASGGEIHKGITKDWVQAIIEGRKPLIAPGEDGIKSLELSNAMLMSTWTDQTISLPIDDDAYYQMLQEKIKNSSYVKKDATNVTMNVAGSFGK